jgi:hypothetical protein
MREHGEPNFPSPDSQGGIRVTGIDASSPTFRSARSACRMFSPHGNQIAALKALRQQEMLVFSKCMRTHGIRDFPDPTNGGQLQLQLNAGQGSDLDPNNARFRRARGMCQGHLPPGGEKELVPAPGL